MITKEQMQKAAEYIRKNCQANDYTFSMNSTDNLLTRFAQNGITQHISGENLFLGLEVAFVNKTGAASVNRLDEDSLKFLIKTAESMARLNQPDPEFVPSEPVHKLPNVNNYSDNTAHLSVEKIVDDIDKCVNNAKSKKAKVSGISQKHLHNYFLSTKNGFKGFDQSTSFSHSMTMKKDDVETKVSRSVKDHAKFSMDELVVQLNTQFDSLQKPLQLEKGRLPVILRPAAVLNWLIYLIWTFDRRNTDEGLTPFTGQIGRKFFGEKFTFRSRLDDPDLSVNKFSGDGIPGRNMNWIVKGVLKNMSVSRYYAKLKKLQAASPYNVIVDGEGTSEAEMMKMVDRGVIVNRLWYIRPIDRKTGEWTGLTRDGVLYFEDSKIKNSVTNFRWNEILHEATKRILALGESVQQEYYARIPAMLIDDFNFVDVTTF